MDVLICTSGRANIHQQATLKVLNDAHVFPTLVIQEEEQYAYGDRLKTMVYDPLVLPHNIRTIADTRDWLVHECTSLKDDKVLMFDDDLHIAVRRDDNRSLFRNPMQKDIHTMLENIDMALNSCPMVGIGPREGGNRNTDHVAYNTRIMRVLGFRKSYLREHKIFFGGVALMEDFHVNLQILRSGTDTCVLNDWVSNQAGGSNAPGGCSSYRKGALQTTAAHKLATLHPGFVRVVQKASNNWGTVGITRTDVVVSWKKARQAGMG
jgi:hypothetical protein